MKRLHIVGKSKDNKKLLLAKTRGAKFGSFEIPIGPKLLKLVHEVEDARNSHRTSARKERDASGEPAPQAPAGSSAAPDAEAAPPAAAGEPGAPAESREQQIDLPVGLRRGGQGPEGGRAAEAGPRDVDATAAPEDEENGEAVDAGLPGQRFREQLRGRMQPRKKRPDIPARSKLSPAEIQTLIRAGRSVRSVAQLAGTSTAWIKWLAEPVEQERMGVVTQALQQRQVRARLGSSAAPLGEAVVLNLRSRGMAAPERIVEEGFSALRDGREWRVRLSYEHRGRRVNAVWSFDPQTKQLVPENTLAAGLGWRPPPGSEETLDEAAARPRRPRGSTGRTRTRSGRASKRTTRKAGTRRSTKSRSQARRRRS